MKKRVLSVLLTVAMLVAMLAGCQAPANTDTTAANETKGTEAPVETDAPTEADQETEPTEKVYDEKIAFTMAGYNTITGVDYTSDVFGKYISELFNVDITVMNNETSGAQDRFNLAATTGTLADSTVVIKWSWPTYYEFVDQGLFAPLPDDWETRWPNIAAMVEQSGFKDYLTVDGKVYALPHTMYGNLTQISPLPMNTTLFFRKDWAAQVGMSDLGADGTISLAELEEYLTKVGAAGLVAEGKSILGARTTDLQRFFKWESGVSSDWFTVTDDGYVWTPSTDGYKDYLATFQEWNNKGLIDPDFYLNDKAYYQNAFNSGLIPATFTDGGVGNVTTHYDSLIANGQIDSVDDLGCAYIEADDGTVYGMEGDNFWLATVFAPETDEKTLERILDMRDWACTKDGQVALVHGVPGEHWEYNEDGTVKILKEWDQSSRMAYMLLGYCGDDLSLSGLVASDVPEITDTVVDIYEIKGSDVLIPNAKAYNIYNSDIKNAYNAELNMNKFETDIVCNKLDVESTVNEFVETNKNYWEPLQEEVNEFVKTFN